MANMKKEMVYKILLETEQGYDLIAEKFSETRKFFWRDLEFISDYTKERDKVLDYGCGNGRLLEIMNGKNIEYQGVDVSQKLIDIASQKYPGKKFQKISGFGTLPFPDNYFNVIYSVAVFHHLPSKQLRLQVTQELYRVTKPGGHIIVTVWNLWRWPYIKDIIKSCFNILINGSKLDWNDCYITFKNNQGEIFNRYHHAFTKRELKNLLITAGYQIEKYKKVKNKNLLIIGRKLN